MVVMTRWSDCERELAPSGVSRMVLKDQALRPNIAATTAADAIAASDVRRGRRTSSQAPSSETAPSGGT